MALAARRPEMLMGLAEEIGALAVACDATMRQDVDRLFADLRGRWQRLDVVLYNASYRNGGPLVDLDPAEVERSLAVCAYGGFLVAEQAARWMLRQNGGAILFTGASASVKGYARSAPFAIGKFALRGLARAWRASFRRRTSTWRYLAILDQPRCAWTWEVELRPWVERF